MAASCHFSLHSGKELSRLVRSGCAPFNQTATPRFCLHGLLMQAKSDVRNLCFDFPNWVPEVASSSLSGETSPVRQYSRAYLYHLHEVPGLSGVYLFLPRPLAMAMQGSRIYHSGRSITEIWNCKHGSRACVFVACVAPFV